MNVRMNFTSNEQLILISLGSLLGTAFLSILLWNLKEFVKAIKQMGKDISEMKLSYVHSNGKISGLEEKAEVLFNRTEKLEIINRDLDKRIYTVEGKLK